MEDIKYIDIDNISEEIGIEMDALLELLSIYRDEMSQEMLQIRQQLINQDWTSLQRTIHNIKGVSANLCIQPMYEISAAIDLKLKAENRACIHNDINELNDIFDATASEIQSILEMKSLKA